jgi:Protein of unknown function (DUF2909)
VKILIAVALLAIVASLGKALFAMSSGQGNPEQMVRALTVRIVLSVTLFIVLMAGWYLGLIQPQSVR